MACACTHVARAAHDDAADEAACEHGVLRLLDDYSSDEARNAANDGALLDGVGAHGGELLHRVRRRLPAAGPAAGPSLSPTGGTITSSTIKGGGLGGGKAAGGALPWSAATVTPRVTPLGGAPSPSSKGYW